LKHKLKFEFTVEMSLYVAIMSSTIHEQSMSHTDQLTINAQLLARHKCLYAENINFFVHT